MSSLNARPVTQQLGQPLWKRSLAALAGAGAGAAVVLLTLIFCPAAALLASDLLSPAISSALASERQAAAPWERRKHRMADAQTAQHGTYVSDPYGCVYMFQYLDAKLSLTPVLGEDRKPLCRR